MSGHSALILWLADAAKEDIATVGKHALSLGKLAEHGFPIPDGFVITSRAYYQFIQENNLADKIHGILATVSYEHPELLMQVSANIRKLFMHGHLSPDLIKDLDMAYKRIGGVFHQSRVKITSSVTAQSLPAVSFAGHHHEFEDIHGEANLILKIREIWASFFDPEALLSRHHQQFDHFQIAVPVIVQKMVKPDKSGVMVTIEPLKGDKAKIIIDAVEGSIEPLLKGKVIPDHYVIRKKDLSVDTREVRKKTLTDNQIMDLALLGRKLDKTHFPQIITWGIEKRHIYFLDIKQVIIAETPENAHEVPAHRLKLLLQGAAISPGMVTGPVRIIHNITDSQKIVPGDIAVLQHIHFSYSNNLKKAGAIISDHGGRTSHASIAIRHLGIPAVVGSSNATEKLRNGMVVTVNGSRGEVYEGSPHQSKTSEENSQLSTPNSQLKTSTRVYVTLSHSSLIEKTAQEHVNGVGLLKGEILMKELSMTPHEAIEKGKRLTYTSELAEKIALFCRAFYPRPILYRLSDTGSSLGLRGTYRHLHHQNLLKLELEAIKAVRNDLKLHNLGIIIPVVRKVRELEDIKRVISDAGLHRSATFKLWMTVATPANVLLIDAFIKEGIDGVAIDTTELATFTLGIDPKDHDVAHLFDEIDPSVLAAIEQVIKTAKKHHIPSSLTGLAPSLYPSLLDKAVGWGITAVSVSPDVIDTTRHNLMLFERKHTEQK